MITSTETNQTSQEYDPLLEFLETSGVSSIQMIASALETDEESIITQIENLIGLGILHGYITEDRTRFFKSDIKMSKAPSIRSNAEELIIEHPNTKNSKYAMVGGIVSIIGGLVGRSIAPASEVLQSIGASFVLIGMIILAGGWLFLSKQTSSVKSI
ncbi:MAG: hypothetical protein ACFFED_12655 [Candidatus Thorarchaeota archaeon]